MISSHQSFLLPAVGLLFASVVGASGAQASTVGFRTSHDAIIVSSPKLKSGFQISLKCPKFTLGDRMVGGDPLPSVVQGDINSGRPVEVDYAPISLGVGNLEVKLHLQWSPQERVLRKWASYRMVGIDTPIVVKEIVLEDMDPSVRGTQPCAGPWQSYPVFGPGFFAGIEFPAASTRVEGGRVILAHRPGLRMEQGTWYDSRKAVIGFSPEGKEKDAFGDYIALHYPCPKKLHLSYNSWWTTPIPYTEDDVLEIMHTLKGNLCKPYGVSLDSFCIDMGWSDRRSIWGISRERFPMGLKRAQEASAAIGAELGLWLSPVSTYPEALDNNWAKEQGYKTFESTLGGQPYPLLCMTDKRYTAEMTKNLVNLINEYGVCEFKLDNFRFECPATDHGHEPGALAAESLADAVVTVFDDIRKAAPNVWFESSAFGIHQSPWWLFHVNSVLGNIGDDYPYGLVPCPIYHESYTTARDYFNLCGVKVIPSPIRDQTQLGINLQSPESFINDAVVAVMRGNLFIPLYTNPAYINSGQWRALAGVLKWARKNQDTLRHTKVIFPASLAEGSNAVLPKERPMPREPYGYAHWRGNHGLIELRNPWIAPRSYSLKLDESTGTPKGVSELSVVGLYPRTRLYGQHLQHGSTVRIPLAPYETVVLSVASGQRVKGLQRVPHIPTRYLVTNPVSSETRRVEFDGAGDALGDDSTDLLGNTTSALSVKLDVNVTVRSPKAQLLILVEDQKPVVDPICKITIDGKTTPVTVSGSDTAWAAAGIPQTEHWLFLCAPLNDDRNQVSIDLLTRSSTQKVSVWAWATKDAPTGSTDPYPNALPKPEFVSLDAVNLLRETDLNASGLATVRMSRPVERISGVYLDVLARSQASVQADAGGTSGARPGDALNTVLVSDEAGPFLVNKSIADKPIVVFGRHYSRGLGTRAPSRISVPLDAKYKRFQSWIGVDAGIAVWDESFVGFEVWVDGDKRWESGPMERNVAGKWVDVDVSGAKRLDLVVKNLCTRKTVGGACWADWADARLLK